MLRRAALILCLLLPVAGRATTSGAIDFTKPTFGSSDCTSTVASETMTWNAAFQSGFTTVPATGATYSVFASSSAYVSGQPCPTTDAAHTVASGNTALLTGTIQATPKDLVTLALSGACSAAATIYVCVEVLDSAKAVVAVASGSIALQVLPPPVPENVTASPGDSALYLSWSDGSDSTVGADHYEATVTPVTATDDVTHTKSFSSNSNQKFDGLKNGVWYQAKVRSVSAGNDKSAWSVPSNPAQPLPVDDFWNQYKNAGGLEQGGCGGPVGALSLLSLAGLWRLVRRRS
jgi:hypothetical protein